MENFRWGALMRYQVFLMAQSFVLLYSCYRLTSFGMVLSVILQSVLMILLSTLDVIETLICESSLKMASELEFELPDTVGWGRKFMLISTLAKPKKSSV